MALFFQRKQETTFFVIISRTFWASFCLGCILIRDTGKKEGSHPNLAANPMAPLTVIFTKSNIK